MSIYDITVKTIRGEDCCLDKFHGQTLLIVNTASSCGFTPQFSGLEKLYQQYKEQNFQVLGFPCNQFLQQEKKSHEEIQSFCQINFGVTFPLFEKIKVNGTDQSPLYAYLKSQQGGAMGKQIKWNFTKFLVTKTGEVSHRFSPSTTPEEIAPVIESIL